MNISKLQYESLVAGAVVQLVGCGGLDGWRVEREVGCGNCAGWWGWSLLVKTLNNMKAPRSGDFFGYFFSRLKKYLAEGIIKKHMKYQNDVKIN